MRATYVAQWDILAVAKSLCKQDQNLWEGSK
jgi:hypothetical protein